MHPSSVAVIDIGSNSIKLLVVTKETAGRLTALRQTSLDARIGDGLNQARPLLSEAGCARALAAITELLESARLFSPDKTILSATSAVRDADNRNAFVEQVRAATGHTIRILSGDEEAALIGRGLVCDPELGHLKNFLLFDLGGGSLECLRFENRHVTQAMSLPIGCVRMTERFFPDIEPPLNHEAAINLAKHVRDTLQSARFRCPLHGFDAVFTGGSMSTVRAIKGALHGVGLEETPAIVATDSLVHLIDDIAPLSLDERRGIPGLPAARADVFPAALITMLAIAEYGGIERFHHSLYNLRWGLADEALAQNPAAVEK